MNKRNTKHGLRYHTLYTTWKDMKRRCFNSNHKQYKYWGGRGIIVCDEWKNDFQEFYDYCTTCKQPWTRGLQIDRINNNGNYEPGNIRFVKSKINANNRRNHVPHKRSNNLPTGVLFCKNKKTKQYRASIVINKKRKHLGYFSTPEEASKIYQQAKKEV